MKKISYVAFLLLTLVASVFAAEGEKFHYQCYNKGLSKEGDSPVAAPDVGRYCYVNYGKAMADSAVQSKDDLAENGSTTNWNDVVNVIQTYPNGVSLNSLHLILLSDLKFPGYNDTTKSCFDNASSITLTEKDFTQTAFVFDGKKHVIKNYCQQGRHEVGFFGTLLTKHNELNDVTFENAYIEMTDDNTASTLNKVAVFVDSVGPGSLTGISVKNSKIVVNNNSGKNSEIFLGAIGARVGNVQIQQDTVENVSITGSVGTLGSGSFYVGGLVGTADFIGDEGRGTFTANRAFVQIDLPEVADVDVGGLAGFVRVGGGSYHYIQRNYVSPHTSINGENADSLFIIKLSQKEMRRVNAGGLVGRLYAVSLFDECSVENNSVVGRLSVAATKITSDDSPLESGAVGGLFGYVFLGDRMLTIIYNKIIGDVDVNDMFVGTGSYYCGYVAGVVEESLGSNAKNRLLLNYHYGFADQNVDKYVKFWGVFGADGPKEIDSSIRNEIRYNYRNAIGKGNDVKLAANGSLNYEGTVYGPNATYDNPILSEEDMKSRLFAYVLIENGKAISVASGNAHPSWEVDSTNGGLPYITDKQSVYMVAIDISKFSNFTVSPVENDLYDKFKNLKKFYDSKRDRTQYRYVALTDINGRLPKDFVDAYEKDVKNSGYALNYDNRAATLSPYKVYELKKRSGYHEYEVVEEIPFNIEYGILGLDPNGGHRIDKFEDETYFVYSPAKVEKAGAYDVTKIIPRIFDTSDNNAEWFVGAYELRCVNEEGLDVRKEGDDVDINHWSLSRILNEIVSAGDVYKTCANTPTLRLGYEKLSTGVAKTIAVSPNEWSLDTPVEIYGYKKGQLERLDSTSVGPDPVYVPWTSQYKIDLMSRGYEHVKPMEVDVWYFDQYFYASAEMLLDCLKDHPLKLDGCFEQTEYEHKYYDSASAYLGSPDEISAAIETYPAVRWRVPLDSSKKISLDSLTAGLFRNVNTDLSNVLIKIVPRPNVIPEIYNIAFMLDDTTGVLREYPFYHSQTGEVYAWGDTVDYCIDGDLCMRDYPHDIYRNDGCVVGWTSENMKMNDSTLKFGLGGDFQFELLSEALEPGASTLYPLWAPAAYCAEEKLSEEDNVKWSGANVEGTFTRTVMNVLGGEVIILDIDKRAEILDTTIRYLGKSKSMLLPLNDPVEIAITRKRILQFEAKAGFKAPEYMTLSYDSSRVSDFSNLDVDFTSIHVKDGDSLPSDLRWSVLEGVFEMVDTSSLAFVDTAVISSGYAARLKVSTTKFAAGRDATLKISFTDNLGNELKFPKAIDTAIVETPFVLDTTFILRPGSYVVRGELRDAWDSVATFTSHVVVSSEIPAGKDKWIMVNLKAVDMKSVGKDDDQIFYWWNDNADVGEFWRYIRFIPGEDLAANRGYWYSSLEGRSLKINTSYVDSVYDVVWNLVNGYDGWNLVSNPHSWDIAVPDSLDMSCWDESVSNYDDCHNVLRGFRAAWVHVEKSNKVKLKGEPVFTSGVAGFKKRALAKAKNAENWTISAVLADNRGHQDFWNVLGMGEELEGYEPPAGMGDQVNFSIKNGKKFLAKSVKAAPASSKDAADLEWDVVLSASSDRKGKLSFDGLDGIAGFGYHLYVTMDGKTSELMAGDTLPVALKAAGTTAKVRVTKEKLYFKTSVDGLRMAQSGNKLNVSFTATENLAGTRVVVDVLGMDGKVISSIADKAAAGTNAVTLDAPKPGLYMLRVRVASQQASRKILVK